MKIVSSLSASDKGFTSVKTQTRDHDTLDAWLSLEVAS